MKLTHPAEILIPILACVISVNVVAQPSPAPAKPMTAAERADFEKWVMHADPLKDSDTGDQCTNQTPHFDFAASLQPTAHPFVCRQDSHMDWYRQQVRGIHVTNCMNTPLRTATCDMSVIRLCRPDAVGSQSMAAPCTGPTSPNMTGPKGCAICGDVTYTPEKP
jgi:hypothetical protein